MREVRARPLDTSLESEAPVVSHLSLGNVPRR
jgi:hypothetical protein